MSYGVVNRWPPFFYAYNLKKSHYNKVLPLLYYISGINYPVFYYKMSCLFAKKLDKLKKC